MNAIEKTVKCEVIALSYDLATRTGYLELPEMNCTDMNGAIKLFKVIDPRVQCIVAGDVFYHRIRNKWCADGFSKKHGDMHVHVNVGFEDYCREKEESPPFIYGDVVRFKKGALNISGRQTVGTVDCVDDRSVSFLSKDGMRCDGMLHEVEMVREFRK